LTYMPSTMAEADPGGRRCPDGIDSPTSMIIEGLLIQPRMYDIKFAMSLVKFLLVMLQVLNLPDLASLT